ncbi:MAG: hypothetical protein ACTTKL_08890, partial [Treponema sp.]
SGGQNPRRIKRARHNRYRHAAGTRLGAEVTADAAATQETAGSGDCRARKCFADGGEFSGRKSN